MNEQELTPNNEANESVLPNDIIKLAKELKLYDEISDENYFQNYLICKDDDLPNILDHVASREILNIPKDAAYFYEINEDVRSVYDVNVKVTEFLKNLDNEKEGKKIVIIKGLEKIISKDLKNYSPTAPASFLHQLYDQELYDHIEGTSRKSKLKNKIFLFNYINPDNFKEKEDYQLCLKHIVGSQFRSQNPWMVDDKNTNL